jgi:hypothetical protein
MKSLTAFALLPLLFGCATDQEFDIPTISIEDGGAGLLTSAGNPNEAYHKAYATVIKKANRIEGMEAREKLFLDRILLNIVKNLKTMQTLLVDPAPETVNPLIDFYSEMYQKANRKQIQLGNWDKAKFLKRKREVQKNFAPPIVSLTKTNPTDPEKGEIPPPLEEKGMVPPPGEEKGKEPVVIKDPAPAPKKDSSAAEYRLLYKAWVNSHEELVEAFQKKQNTNPSYEEVVTSLEKISGLLKPKKAETLVVYRNFYARIHEDTAGFTTLPAGAKKEDILNDLRIVFSGIQKELTPAQGK